MKYGKNERNAYMSVYLGTVTSKQTTEIWIRAYVLYSRDLGFG